MEEEEKRRIAKAKAIAKAKRIKEMKLEAKYPIDIWNKLKLERIKLMEHRKKGDHTKIIEVEDNIQILQREGV